MADLTFTPQQVDALAKVMKENKPQGGNTSAFCKDWPTAKSVLQALQPLLAGIPGIGIFAGPAIGIVIAAGDAAYKAFCT